MTIKILAIGDTADNFYILKKFANNVKIHQIVFPQKEETLFTDSTDGVEIFDSILISRQIKRINEIKNEYDLCITLGWAAARIAYLAGINYIMYFVGNDITTPPFERKIKPSYLKSPLDNRNYLERHFYKKVFDSAIAHIAPMEEYFGKLKKYKKNAIRLDRIFVDTSLFNESVKPIQYKKKKFTFLAPQRVSLEKGYDIIWNALKLCKTDFQVLQIEWFDERNEEEIKIKNEFLNEIPHQIKFISTIKRKDIPRYVMMADAILGQMRVGELGGIERDAAFCRKPILSYNNTKIHAIVDGEKIFSPFLPTTKDPIKVAELIDNIVESKEFREKLANKEFEYVNKLSNPNLVIKEWEVIFEKLKNEHESICRKQSFFNKKFEMIFFKLLERIYLKKMKRKNIIAFGEEEYRKLTLN